MKTITQNLVKGLLVIVLFTGVSIVASASGPGSAQQGGIAQNGGQQAGQLTAGSVNQYLISNGYQVNSVSPIAGTTNWSANTINANGVQCITTIYINCGLVHNTDVAL